MSGQKKKVAVESSIDTTAWMITFSDLLQLLLTFFVLLISMSSLDVKALKEMFSFFPGAVGVLEFSKFSEVQRPAFAPQLKPQAINEDELRRLLQKKVSLIPGVGHTGLVDDVGVTKITGGLKLTLPNQFLFKTGKADINPNAHVVLDSLLDVLKFTKNRLEIYGHTDNRPINTPKFSSNWELSVARSVKIVEYFLTKGIKPGRISAVGFGEQKPLVPNNTKKHRSRNRRVEIQITQTQI